MRLFVNLDLFDGISPNLVRGAAILVEGSTITALGPETDVRSLLPDDPALPTLDLKGSVVVPGLMNLHEHLTWRRNTLGWAKGVVGRTPSRLMARAAGHALLSLAEGVTTIRDCASKAGSALELRDAIAAGEALGPRIHAVGEAISMSGGHGTGAVREADGVDDVRRAAREQLNRGADWIKLMASGGFMLPDIDQPEQDQFSAEELRAAFEEAHSAGMRATVHVHPPSAIRRAIGAGVDCLEHAGLADRASAELIAEHEVFVVPTLCTTLYDVEAADRQGHSDWLVEKDRAHVPEVAQGFEWMLEAGCKIAAGTDGSGDIQHELGYMVRLGMTPYQALRAATAIAAQCLGVEDKVGTLQPGKLADFIAVRGNPLVDIGALNHILLTVKDGELYSPRVLRSVLGPGIHSDLPMPGDDLVVVG